jgi:hypothetical protein
MAVQQIYNPLATFRPIINRKRGFSSARKNRGIFEQIVPSNKAGFDNKDRDYLLDSLFKIPSNQSLTQEQIIKSQTRAIDDKLGLLFHKYEIAKVEEVKNFLSKHRFLISLIEEIPSRIYNYFGENQKLALRVSFEPEYPNSSELWIEILTELSATDAMPLLEKFDEDWWLENLERANYKLNITLKFI